MERLIEQYYKQYQPILFSLAYRMLGTVSDAEDIVQDVFIRLQREELSTIRHPKAYLCQMTTNRCLDLLKSARKQREVYVGPWLPEPIMTDNGSDPAADVLQDETISFAILQLMETLTPIERAIFILREAFEFDYRAIADIIQKSEVSCRKTMSRVKPKIDGIRLTAAPPSESTPLIQRFIDAARAGHIEAMLRMLAEDVVLYSDGGGKVAAAPRPIMLRANVGRFMAGLTRQLLESDQPAEIELLPLNGHLGLLLRQTGTPYSALAFDVRAAHIQSIYIVRNPDKLRHL